MREKKNGMLDPRTKLALLITISIYVLGGIGGGRMQYCAMLLSIVPIVLLCVEGMRKECVIYLAVYALGYCAKEMLLPISTGLVGFLLLATCGMITRMMPGIMMGRYVLSTTKVSEFVAAMERMHITNKVTIPISVIFRFFPTISEEYTAINDAMKMRGISMGGGRVLQMLEYRLIPMMTCSVKIGEELSAAALTRGLGAPTKRTHICKIGFGIWDYCLLFLCVGVYMFGIAGLWRG